MPSVSLCDFCTCTSRLLSAVAAERCTLWEHPLFSLVHWFLFFFFSIFLRTAVLSRQYTLEVLYFMSISSLPEDHLACEFMIKIETIRSKLSWHHTPPTSLFISILLLTLFSYASKRKCSDSFKWIPTFCLGSLPYPFLLCSFKLCSIIYLLSQLFSLSHFRNDHDFSVFIK